MGLSKFALILLHCKSKQPLHHNYDLCSLTIPESNFLLILFWKQFYHSAPFHKPTNLNPLLVLSLILFHLGSSLQCLDYVQQYAS